MQDSFDPHSIEQPLYQEWESKGYFAPQGDGPAYCILIPPPNVTGSLHMGHAFQHTLMDTLIRFHRMCGDRTLWQMGTDHAGISTQMVVERQLAMQQTNRTDIGRDKFLEKVWQWKQESGNEIADQLRRMGSSLDWSRNRFTMDEGFSAAVQEVFVRLFDEKLIYRGKRLVNWDPHLKTAISDLEVENHEEQGHLWHFRYPLCDGASTRDGKNYLVVATTRPETMLGDTAVAVHPDDERYRDLVGKYVKLPLADRKIPIIADEYVDREFGSGCVKITPAHDFNDYEIGLRHDLPMINIFTEDAHINDAAPKPYQGLDRFQAREKVVSDLTAIGALEKIEEHRLMVPRGDRTDAIIEPYLTNQWFVDIKPLARPAIDVVEAGEIEFVPKQYENIYFSWMRDIKDWCISRQLWWGHRIPAWYDEKGNIFVAKDEQAVREKYQLGADVRLQQDPDVLETWFSSALWSFATLGWPQQTEELALYHPTNVLVTGHDIIFFWVARMIMMSLKFMGEIPFHQVYIHGLVRDSEGKKMSKSRGNGLDPLDVVDGISLEKLVEKRTQGLMQPQLADRIEKNLRREYPDGIPSYGTDALRFTFCALASTGRDIRFDLKRVEGYRNFCNKLWNATKFVLQNCEGKDLTGSSRLSVLDKWIRSRAHRMLDDVERALETYRFDMLAQAIYEFAWGEYCDWYLELVKPMLWDENQDPELARGTRQTLLQILEILLRVAHPVMPFITEELWRRIAPLARVSGDTIMLQPWPGTEELALDPEAEADVDWLQQAITGIRTIRGEQNIKPGQTLPLLLQGGDENDRSRLTNTQTLLQRLAKIDQIGWLKSEDKPPPAAIQLVGNLKLLVPLEGVIDLAAEHDRLAKEIAKRTQELKRVQKKLENEKFLVKAPPAVVEKERGKAEEITRALSLLQEQQARLKASSPEESDPRVT